jgi:hypothetical protein
MSIHTAWQSTLHFYGDQPIVVEPSAAQLSSDAGLLPIREFDDRIGWTQRFAEALDDPRQPAGIDHTLLEMVRARVYGLLADYQDQNDHDTLRHDPIFKLIAGRSPEAAPLASQPTLSRFENSISSACLFRLRDLFIDQFIACFATPPRQLTFDLDAVDDAAHGQQQLALFHGYFDQYQYFPLFITCADNDQFVTVTLRHGSAPAAFAADTELEYLVHRLRQAWPDVRISVRGDAGFGVPKMYAVCERLHLDYTFGLAANSVLQGQTAALLAEAVERCAATGLAQRLFTAFGYQAQTWPVPRWVVAKVEANAQGTNRRFVVTNRPGAFVLPDAAYDEYVQRGEAENRNKEIKCGMAMDRLSDHRFKANFFRLYLHALALNLLVRLRREIAAPPAPLATDVPTGALAGAERRRFFQRRRQVDPLGEGQPCTWRSLLVKVAAEVVVSTRRVLVRLAANWPHLDLYRHLCEHLTKRVPPALNRSG